MWEGGGVSEGEGDKWREEEEKDEELEKKTLEWIED